MDDLFIRRVLFRACAMSIAWALLFAPYASAQNLGVRLRSHVDSLAHAGGYRTRAVFTEGNRWSANYVLRQMQTSAPNARLDTFIVKTRRGSTPLVNVVAELPGASDSLIVICAHLDATGNRQGTWLRDPMHAPAPGAVDNATGISSVLEVLALASRAENKLPYALMVVACNAEERNPAYANPHDHHLGSRDMAQRLRAAGRKVKCVIALDMVGYSPQSDFVHLFATGRSQWLARELFQLHDRLRLKLVMPRVATPCSRSDNDSFERAGFPSVLFMESCEPWRASPGHPRNPGYHSSGDLPKLVNYTVLEQVTRLVAAYVMKGS